MKILILDPNNPNSDILYNALDNIFLLLADKFPRLFLHTINYNGQELQIPKYITEKQYNSLDKDTKDLFNELWNLVEISNTK